MQENLCAMQITKKAIKINSLVCNLENFLCLFEINEKFEENISPEVTSQ